MSRNIDLKFSRSISMADAVGKFIQDERIGDKLKNVSMLESFRSILPSSSRDKITQVKLEKHKLFVTVESSALRQDLNYSKESLLEMLHEKTGETIVRQIVFK